MARRASRTTFNSQKVSARGARFEGRRGFTIVELLIVIVVIAILAAITIVAYNGIQNRAKASAAQAAAKQAFTKIQTFAVSNADTYPADLAAAGLANSDGTSYQYRVDNNANPKTFCLTTTTSNVSYFISNTTNAPTAGGCPGHGVDGMPPAPITNLVSNPSGESGAPMFLLAGSGSGGAIADSTARADSGTHSTRFTWGGSGPKGMESAVVTVMPNTAYQVSVSTYVESGEIPQWRVADGSYGSQALLTPVPTTGAWHRSRITYTTQPGQTTLRLYNTVTSSSVYFADSLLIARGTDSFILNYADGNSPGWVWNGTPNNSTSTGPPL